MTRYDEAYFKNIGVLLEEILEHESNKMEETANLFYEIIKQNKLYLFLLTVCIIIEAAAATLSDSPTPCPLIVMDC